MGCSKLVTQLLSGRDFGVDPPARSSQSSVRPMAHQPLIRGYAALLRVLMLVLLICSKLRLVVRGPKKPTANATTSQQAAI